MQVRMIFSGTAFELCLCEMVNGSWRPVQGTFHIPIPPEWIDALLDHDRKREVDFILALDGA